MCVRLREFFSLHLLRKLRLIVIRSVYHELLLRLTTKMLSSFSVQLENSCRAAAIIIIHLRQHPRIISALCVVLHLATRKAQENVLRTLFTTKSFKYDSENGDHQEKWRIMIYSADMKKIDLKAM